MGSPTSRGLCLTCLASIELGDRAGEFAIREGEPPLAGVSVGTEKMPAPSTPRKASRAWYVLALACVAITLGSAIWIASWRNPVTGLPIPVLAELALPMLVGGACYLVGAGVLKYLRVPAHDEHLVDPISRPRHHTSFLAIFVFWILVGMSTLLYLAWMVRGE